jgi:hypothetical protein
MLKTIVREYYPGKSRMIVPPGLEGELEAMTLA